MANDHFMQESEIRTKLESSNKVIIQKRNDSDIHCPVKQYDGKWSRDGILHPTNEEEFLFQDAEDFVEILKVTPLDMYEVQFVNTETPYDMWTFMKTKEGYSLWPGDEYGQRSDYTINNPEDTRRFDSLEQMIEFISKLDGIHQFSSATEEFIILVENGEVHESTKGWFSPSLPKTLASWKELLSKSQNNV